MILRPDPPHGRHARPSDGVRLDLVGTALSALGLGLIVYGILRSGTWGFVQPEAGRARVARAVAGDLADARRRRRCCSLFLSWENHLIAHGDEPLLDSRDPAQPDAARRAHRVLLPVPAAGRACSSSVPLFLSVALGLSAIATGVRLLPLSITLLLAAVGVPRLFPNASPRRVVQLGFLALFAGIVVLVAALDAGAGPEIVTWPMLLAGLGIGALASQLGAVTVSSVPDEQSGEVGGLQNTVTNLGASIGTALAGAVLISALTSSFFTGIAEQPRRSRRVVVEGAESSWRAACRSSPTPTSKTALDEADVPPDGRRRHRRRERRRPHRRAAGRARPCSACSPSSRSWRPAGCRLCRPAPRSRTRPPRPAPPDRPRGRRDLPWFVWLK